MNPVVRRGLAVGFGLPLQEYPDPHKQRQCRQNAEYATATLPESGFKRVVARHWFTRRIGDG